MTSGKRSLKAGLVLIATFMVMMGMPSSAGAVSFDTNFVQAFRPPNTPIDLPALIDATPGSENASITLQFFVPDFASIATITSIVVNLGVADDATDGTDCLCESGIVLFAGPGPNVEIFAFGPEDLAISGPVTVSGAVASQDLEDAQAEITENGFFRLRVRREVGDFLVNAAAVEIDGTVNAVPEPMSAWLLGAAASAWLLRVSRRR